MEAAGLAIGVVGLASLFGSCVDTWGFISARRSFAQEFALQQTKLDIEKTLFLQWGCRMGIIAVEHEEEVVLDPRITDGRPETQAAVINILLAMKKLLTDSEQLRLKYGITVSEDENSTGGGDEDEDNAGLNRVSGSMMRAFEDWQRRTRTHQNNTSVWRKTRWVCGDRDKFITFVNEMNYFNLKLRALTPPVHVVQQIMVKQIVDGLGSDLATLRLVRDASANLHRDWSDAATEQILASEASGESRDGSDGEGEGFELIHRWQHGPENDHAQEQPPLYGVPIPDDILDIITNVANNCITLRAILETRANPRLAKLGKSPLLHDVKMRLQLHRSRLGDMVLQQTKLDVLRTGLQGWAEQVRQLEKNIQGKRQDTGRWSRYLDGIPYDNDHQEKEGDDIKSAIEDLETNLVWGGRI